MGNKTINMEGKYFSRLLVIRKDHKGNGREWIWLVRCVCCMSFVVSGDSIRAGRVKSCGCGRGSTGYLIHQREYRSWNNMLSRCTNPNHEFYKDYGARDIGVCDRWKKFKAFYDDMGERPPGKSLERIDNNKGYSPGNCCWATRMVQANNRRSNRYISLRGIKLTVAQWSKVVGINKSTLLNRFDKQWPIREALTTRPDQKYNGWHTRREKETDDST